MAGQQQRESAGIISGINVTPLVDITLVLLIIFLVTAKVMVTPAVPLDLPAAAKAEEQHTVFSVIVPKKGAILVNGDAITDDDALLTAARGALAADSGLRAVINGDGDVPHRQMLHILDLLKQAGLTAIAFGAKPLEPPP